MNRTRILAVGLAVALAGGAGAAVRSASLSRRLQDAEQDRRQLLGESRSRGANLQRTHDELRAAERRLRRLAGAQKALDALRDRARRAVVEACFEEPWDVPDDTRGPMRGDVDGDLSPDDVYVVGLPRDRGPCSYQVVVDMGAGVTATAPLRTARHATQAEDLRFYARPAFLVELDAEPGYEVGVQTSQGAAGAGYQLFTMVAGKLVGLERPGRLGWSFASTGSAGGGTGLGCAGSGRIVEGRYGYAVAAKDHTVERRFYRVVGSTLVLEETRTYDLPYGRETGRFPELRWGGVPFPICDARIPPFRPPR